MNTNNTNMNIDKLKSIYKNLITNELNNNNDCDDFYFFFFYTMENEYCTIEYNSIGIMLNILNDETNCEYLSIFFDTDTLKNTIKNNANYSPAKIENIISQLNNYVNNEYLN